MKKTTSRAFSKRIHYTALLTDAEFKIGDYISEGTPGPHRPFNVSRKQWNQWEAERKKTGKMPVAQATFEATAKKLFHLLAANVTKTRWEVKVRRLLEQIASTVTGQVLLRELNSRSHTVLIVPYTNVDLNAVTRNTTSTNTPFRTQSARMY